MTSRTYLELTPTCVLLMAIFTPDIHCFQISRTWKTYDLPWSKTGAITVSSSPGLVGYSKDDWCADGGGGWWSTARMTGAHTYPPI